MPWMDLPTTTCTGGRPRDGGWICGGPTDVVISFNHIELDEYWVVVDRHGGDGRFEIVCGGQPSEYPATYRTTKDAAVIAAQHFLATGTRTAELAWEPA